MIKKDLEFRVKNENISNVKLLPLQSRDEYFNIVNSSDISFVSLDKRMTAPCIPGKLINLIGIGKPIIASVSNKSETSKLLKRAKCGLVVEPGNIDELAKSILKLKNDNKKQQNMRQNGINFFKNNMDLEKIVLKYENIFDFLN